MLNLSLVVNIHHDSSLFIYCILIKINFRSHILPSDGSGRDEGLASFVARRDEETRLPMPYTQLKKKNIPSACQEKSQCRS